MGRVVSEAVWPEWREFVGRWIEWGVWLAAFARASAML
jgi:hypothetical protein